MKLDAGAAAVATVGGDASMNKPMMNVFLAAALPFWGDYFYWAYQMIRRGRRESERLARKQDGTRSKSVSNPRCSPRKDCEQGGGSLFKIKVFQFHFF